MTTQQNCKNRPAGFSSQYRRKESRGEKRRKMVASATTTVLSAGTVEVGSPGLRKDAPPAAAPEAETRKREKPFVFGSTDKYIAAKDALAEKAMLAAVLVAFQLVLLLQKVAGLGPLFAAMPVFMFLIGSEWMIQSVSNFHSAAARYTVAGLICSVSAGVVQQIGGVLLKKGFLIFGNYPYELLYERIGTPMGGLVTQRILALVFQDLCYYWSHRCYHQIEVGWMFHAIHHNNDHYNFAVALRQSWGNQLSSWIFYLPLALFIRPDALQWAAEWNLIYQFWVHTCLVRRCPDWVEYLLSTPSHHRVHHDRRLHKNFAGIFIFWDRMFGTFLSEVKVGSEVRIAQEGGDLTRLEDGEEVSVFGTMANQENYLVDLLQLQHPLRTLRTMSKAKTLRAKLKVAMEGAGFYSAVHKDRGIMPRVGVPVTRRIRFASSYSALGNTYVLVHFTIAVLQFILTSVSPDLLGQSFAGVSAAYLPVLVCLCSLARLSDGGKHAPFAEALRCFWAASCVTDRTAAAGSAAFHFYLFSGLVAIFNPEWLRANKVVRPVKTN